MTEEQSIRPRRERKQTVWHGVVPDPGPVRKRKASAAVPDGGKGDKRARPTPAQKREANAVATRDREWKGTYMLQGAHARKGELKYQIRIGPVTVQRIEHAERRDAFGDG